MGARAEIGADEVAIPGYQVDEVLADGNSLVLAGRREGDGRPVVLKILRGEGATHEQLTRHRREFQILTRLAGVRGVPEVQGLEKHGAAWVLVLGATGGVALDRRLRRGRIELGEALQVALQVAEALAEVHRRDVIHKDICPANILWDPGRGEARLIDFGIASVLSREDAAPSHPSVIEGTLAYISPEQSGRMNRSIDYRTDFYSLGVTLYELLTGRLPFATTDPLELLHCHLARDPAAPHELDPRVPRALSRLVGRLLRKGAEERYQSADGLAADLRRCLSQWTDTGAIDDDLLLGQDDRSTQFQIHQKLYGRAAEQRAIVERFAAASAGRAELLLVSGYSGIGKSSLVQEVYRPITEKRGYFVAGKYDQFQRNVPYSAVIKAFQALLRQILTESPEELARWREELSAALGSSGQVVVDVIGELRLIIGPQPQPPPLGPAEAQSRFNLTFQAFIRVFCRPDHPLVLFLDDLQWADGASLQLLDVIVADEQSRHLLVIGAYRDNEVGATHPLALTLAGLRRRGASIHEITLAPLALDDLTALVADTCRRAHDEARPLAELLLAKTGGNPFFANQFLRTLHHEGLLALAPGGASWRWDLAKIAAQGITDNVVDLMVGKLRRLAPGTQRALELAACVGDTFDLATLSIIHQRDEAATFQDLLPALREGFVLPIEGLSAAGEELRAELVIRRLKFLHDRVQQAAYALIDVDRRRAVHLEIGRLLLARLTPDEVQARVFEVADHLNTGLPLIDGPDERLRLAELDLAAAMRAQSSMAHAIALRYFDAGLGLLPADAWATHYALALALHREAGRSAYLSGDFERATPLLDAALAGARTALEREEIHRVRMNALMTQGRFVEGIREGYRALRLFGVDLPEPQAELEAELARDLEYVRARLGERAIADLEGAPAMTDAGQKVALELLIDLWALAYLAAASTLLCLCSARITRMSLDHGNAPASSFGYVSYGMLVGLAGDHATAYELGHLALRLTERYQHRGVVGKVINLFCHSENPYRRPFRTNIPLYERSHQACMEAGDMVYGVWALFFNVLTRLTAGDPLPAVAAQAAAFLPAVRKIGDENVLWAYQALLRTIRGLAGDAPDPLVLDDEGFDSDAVHALWARNGFDSGINWMAYLRMMLHITYGDPATALALAREVEPRLGANFGFFPQTLHNFYGSLAAAALARDAEDPARADLLRRAQDNQATMRRWAESGPDNFRHRHLLVEAELAALAGKIEALDLYDRAIAAAAEQDCLHVEALAAELAARMWLARERPALARPYLARARDAYRAWGAARKVATLEARLAGLPGEPRPGGATPTTVITTTQARQTSLDVATLVKASQAIASEIELGRLVEKMLEILVEHAGAERGALLVEASGEWSIEAELRLARGVPTITRALRADGADPERGLALRVVHYVARTREALVLADAAHEGSFTRDPYVAARRPRSVLCSPLVRQGALLGVLYFENNLAPQVFVPARVETLRLLGAQAAISLENARLYETLEARVRERTEQLSVALRDVEAKSAQIVALNQRLAAENVRLVAELDVSRRLQRLVLPEGEHLRAHPGYDIACHMQPADEVGGDYYDVIPTAGGLKIGIGDVTGHGVESGAFMLMAHAAVRTLVTTGEADPRRLLIRLNQALYAIARRARIARSMSLALLDLSTDGSVTVTGQHEEVLVARRDGVERIDTDELGFPIALQPDITARTR